MLFARVAAASSAVAEASARNAKIAHLAELFRALAPDEIETVVALLSGEPRQGRIGLQAFQPGKNLECRKLAIQELAP